MGRTPRDRFGRPIETGRRGARPLRAQLSSSRWSGARAVLCTDPFRQGRRSRHPHAVNMARQLYCPRHQGRELDAHLGLPLPTRPGVAVRSHQPSVRGLQSFAGSPSRRMGGPRRPEHRRCPGRSGGSTGAAQSLGKDQSFSSRRRHPPRPVCRGGQDARRCRQFPVRSQAPDRNHPACDDDDGPSGRQPGRIR